MLSRLSKRSFASFSKVKVTQPVVDIDGDEMTRVIWRWIKDIVIKTFAFLTFHCSILNPMSMFPSSTTIFQSRTVTLQTIKWLLTVLTLCWEQKSVLNALQLLLMQAVSRNSILKRCGNRLMELSATFSMALSSVKLLLSIISQDLFLGGLLPLLLVDTPSVINTDVKMVLFPKLVKSNSFLLLLMALKVTKPLFTNSKALKRVSISVCSTLTTRLDRLLAAASAIPSPATCLSNSQQRTLSWRSMTVCSWISLLKNSSKTIKPNSRRKVSIMSIDWLMI